MGLEHEQKNREELVSSKTKKKKGEKDPEVAQPELLYGVLDLRGLGLTDKHVQAMARALRTVPAVQTIDLRQNYVSDKGVSELLDTMHFHHELAQHDSTETLCGKCSSVLHFTDPARQAVFCIDCKIGQWRPAYLLSKVIVREDEEYVTPKRMLKWFEVDYDKDACAVLAKRLNEDRSKSLTLHEPHRVAPERLGLLLPRLLPKPWTWWTEWCSSQGAEKKEVPRGKRAPHRRGRRARAGIAHTVDARSMESMYRDTASGSGRDPAGVGRDTYRADRGRVRSSTNTFRLKMIARGLQAAHLGVRKGRQHSVGLPGDESTRSRNTLHFGCGAL